MSEDQSSGSSPASASSGGTRLRLSPLFVIWALVLVGIFFIRRANADNAQFAFMFTTVAAVCGLGLTALWAVFLSGLPGKLRILIAASCVALPILLGLSFRVQGVDGNLVPIIVPRWQKQEVVKVDVEVAPTENVETSEAIPGLADYPQFFGPNRDGKLSGPKLARDWEANPPEELWRRTVGEGWSGFAIVGDFAVTQEQHGEQEAVVCYKTTTGEVRWVHLDSGRYFTTLGGLGPRATPTIDDGKVFTVGATGILNCLKLSTGELVWSVNILKDNGASPPEWGVAGSPLVVDGKVIVSPGGREDKSLVAYDRETGEKVWAAGSDVAHYSSPVLATLGGVEQVLILNAGTLASHRLEDGEILWEYPWDGKFPNVALPIVLDGDRVLASSGYGVGSHLIQIKVNEDKFFANEIWRTLHMKAKFTNIIEVDGYVYGIDDGQMACLNLDRGRREWKEGRYGHGQEILVQDVLLITTETGEVLLLDPSPEESRELTRMQVFESKTWNPPALAGDYLLVRNDREAACYRLPVVAE